MRFGRGKTSTTTAAFPCSQRDDLPELRRRINAWPQIVRQQTHFQKVRAGPLLIRASSNPATRCQTGKASSTAPKIRQLAKNARETRPAAAQVRAWMAATPWRQRQIGPYVTSLLREWRCSSSRFSRTDQYMVPQGRLATTLTFFARSP